MAREAGVGVELFARAPLPSTQGHQGEAAFATRGPRSPHEPLLALLTILSPLSIRVVLPLGPALFLLASLVLPAALSVL